MKSLMVLTLTVASAAHAERAAVLPLEAKGVLSGATEQLDSELRKAIGALGVDLQDVERTRRHISEATAAGLGEECALMTDACAVRVGLLAEVDVVVTAFVEVIDDRMVMRAARHTVNGKASTKAAGVIALPAVDGGKKIDAIVRRLFRGRGETTPLPFTLTVAPPEAQIELDGAHGTPGTLWLAPGPHTLRVKADGYVPLEQAFEVRPTGEGNALSLSLDPEPSQTTLYVGASAAGIGGILVAAGGLTAGGTEAALATGIVNHAQRPVVQAVGITGLIVAGVGLAVAAVGGGIALTELP
jgi:hypothetical protein